MASVELFGGAPVFFILLAQRLGQDVGQIPDHEKADHALDEDVDLGPLQHEFFPVEKQQEGEIRGAGERGEDQRCREPGAVAADTTGSSSSSQKLLWIPPV